MRPPGCLGDALTCPGCPKPPYCFEGVISVVSTYNVITGGRLPAVLGDQGFCCGSTTLLASTFNVLINGRPPHLIGDTNTCAGTTLGPGALNVFIG